MTAAAARASNSPARSVGRPTAATTAWYTTTAPSPSASRSTKRASRPSIDVGSGRTRNVARSAISNTSAASSTDARSASTTMNAKEIGSGTRNGGRSSISSPAAIAPPMSASAAQFVPASASWVPSATSALPPMSAATCTKRVTLGPPGLRQGLRDRPSRCPPRGARRRIRARPLRDRRRRSRRDVRSPR